MAAVIGELRPHIRLPYGVDLLWDPMAALAVAQAVRASFVREVFTGVYDSDMGLWQPDAAATLDYRRHIGAENVRLFFNIEPEFARPVSPRPIGALAHSVVVSSLADAILISGAMAGAEANLDHIREAKAGCTRYAGTRQYGRQGRDRARHAGRSRWRHRWHRPQIRWLYLEPRRCRARKPIHG